MDTPTLEHGCWADLWSYQNYHGDRLELRGPSDERDLASRPRGKDHTWKNAVTSLTTGPGTWLYAWTDADRRSPRLSVGPSTCLPLLGTEFSGKIRSIAIAARRPDDWPGATLQPKERRGQMMTDLRRRSANATLKSLCESVVGAIPGAGTAMKTILDILWPGGPSKADLVEDGREWVESLLFDVVSGLAKMDYSDAVESLYTAIRRCVEERDLPTARDSYSKLREDVDNYMPKFTGTIVDPAENLGYAVTFGTVALAVYRVDWVWCEELYISPNFDQLDPEEQDKQRQDLEKLKQDHYRDLTTSITKLRGAVLEGLANARAARLKKVSSKHESGAGGGWYQAVDDYSVWKGVRHDYATGRGGGGDEVKAKQRAADETVFYHDDCAAPTFDADFDGYAEVADLWTYFSQPPGIDLKRETRTVRMGMWGRPLPPDSNHVSATFNVQLAGEQRFTEVVLHGDDGCAGIEIYVDTARKGHWGKTKDSETDVTHVRLDEGQEITGVLGTWSPSGLHRVVLRVEPGADGYPYQRGAGTRDGGAGFTSNGPDGVFARLTGLFGQVDDEDRLHALGCQWTYERVVPFQTA